MNVLEVMRLFGECGFEFLPETDLQRRPGLEVVMTVGLHLCALEMTDQQVDTLACIALAGQLPEFFPLLQWSYAVKKSFMSQEVVTCANRDQWNASRGKQHRTLPEIQEWHHPLDQGKPMPTYP